MLLSALVLLSVLLGNNADWAYIPRQRDDVSRMLRSNRGGPLHRYLIATFAIALLTVGCTSKDVDNSASTAAPTTTVAQTTTTPPTTLPPTATMEISSPAFAHQASIPPKYSCEGDDVSPQLDIANVPPNSESLVLIMDDPDAPVGTWDHWVAYDIAPTETIAEGNHEIGTSGINSWGTTGYGGPCPPSGTHRYFFQVYALDVELGVTEGATKTDIIAAMKGHIIDEAQIIGLFSRD